MPGWLIDLDGTMYRGSMPVPGAAEFISRIAGSGHPFLYVTNNSSRRPEQVAEHIRQVTGVEATAKQIVTSAQATAAYVARQKPGSRVFAIGEEGLLQALAESGLVLVKDDQVPDYVVQGIDRDFTYDKLMQAVRHIRAGARYLLTNPDLLLPGDGDVMPGAGSLSASLAAASGTEPLVIGKPSPILLNLAAGKLGLPHHEIWVVGDNVHTDIAGGIAAGCRTALVLTGITSAEQSVELLSKVGLKPDIISSDLLDLWRQLPEHS